MTRTNVDEKMQGATPPNVYELELREELFHGVLEVRHQALFIWASPTD